jgi:gas vesicle protein
MERGQTQQATAVATADGAATAPTPLEAGSTFAAPDGNDYEVISDTTSANGVHEITAVGPDGKSVNLTYNEQTGEFFEGFALQPTAVTESALPVIVSGSTGQAGAGGGPMIGPAPSDEWLPDMQTLRDTASFIADMLWMATPATIAIELGRQLRPVARELKYEAGLALDEVKDAVQEGADELKGEIGDRVSDVGQGINRVNREVREAIHDVEREGANVDARLTGISATTQTIEAMANQVAANTDDAVLRAGAEGLAGAANLARDGIDEIQDALNVDRYRFSRAADDFQSQLDRELSDVGHRVRRGADQLSDRIDAGAEDITNELDRQAARAELTHTAYKRLVGTVKAELQEILSGGLPEIGWPGADTPQS